MSKKLKFNILADTGVILSKAKDLKRRDSSATPQNDKFAILEHVEQLGLTHNDVVDPDRRKFLIRSIHSSTALSAEMKFSLISGIMTLFAPKQALSQIIPFAFFKQNGPTDPPTYSFGSYTAYTWGTGWFGVHAQGNTTSYNSPVLMPGQWAKAYAGRISRFLIDDQSQCYFSGWGNWGMSGLGDTTNRSNLTQLAGNWKMIGSSSAHNIGIRTDGTLWSWGHNSYGQLGHSDLTYRSSPVQIGSDEDWAKVFGSDSHMNFAIKEDGRLFVWGNNSWGGLGTGNTTFYSSPVQVPGSWISAHGGWDSSVGIKSDNTLWTWGINAQGQLGIGNTVSQSSPVQIGAEYKWIEAWKSLSDGIALREDNTAWVWGSNNHGLHGQSDTIDRSSPVQVPGIWRNVHGKRYTHGGVKHDGTLWMWGQNYQGCIGDGTSTDRSSPVQIGSDTDWTRVIINTTSTSTLGLKGDVSSSSSPFNPINSIPGILIGWGQNTSGELGTGNTTNYSSPIQISGEYWAHMDASWNTTLALRNDGTLWTTGTGMALGNGNTSAITTMEQLSGSWIHCSAEHYNGFAIKNDNTLWTWGDATYGQTGHNNTNNSSSPIQIHGGGSWKYASIGNLHGLGIKTDGTLWAWGYGTDGQLAQETSANHQSSPVQVGSDTDWVKSQAGWGHSVALKSDGTLWGFGYGNNGQLGQVTNTNTASSPVQISGTWTDISVNHLKCFGIKPNGSLWAWGRNHNGQLGLGDANDRSSPVQIGSEKWKHVHATFQGAIAVRDDGTLWAWGQNSYGQLGTDNIINTSVPVQVSTHTDWIIAAGNDQTIAIRGVTQGGSGGAKLELPSQLLATPGYLWGNGRNDFGALGLDNTTNYSSPVTQPGLWRAVDADQHTLAIRDDYTLWTFGFNDLGQVGNDSTNHVSSPVQIAGSWVAVTSGIKTSFAIRNDGTLWAWGNGNYGRMGDGSTVARSSPIQVGGSWSFVSGSGSSGHGIKSDGTLWSWGRNNHGQLGNSSSNNQSSPVQIGSDTNWVFIDSERSHLVALKSDYTLWAWGRNHQGQIGDGTITYRSSPVQIAGSFIQATAGYHASGAIRTDGTLWVWGLGSQGTLGQVSNINNYSSPIQIPGSWLQVASSYRTFTALRNDGTRWSWGRNWRGPIGDGTSTTRSSPVQIGADNDWVKVRQGTDHITWAIRYAPPQKSYSLWTWGFNNAGELGHGDRVERSSPVQVPGEWRKISGGWEHALGIKEDNSLWAWGWGTYGNLAQITHNNNRSSPVQIPGEWRDIGAGASHLCFGIRVDGTLWAWGRNQEGGLGTGDVIHRSSPVQVGSENFWKKLGPAGFNHAGAIRMDGTLWMWGRNDFGQVGDSSTTDRSSPVQVAGLWREVISSDEFSLGIKADGTLWSWGRGSYGRLGHGNTNGASSPIQIGTHTWKTVNSHSYHILAVRSDDTIWAWGRNTTGELGLGDTNNRSSPVQVPGYAVDFGTGREHTHIVKTNGTLWAMGDNADGQLGNNTTDNEYSPIKIGPHEDWAVVESPRVNATFALRDNVAPNSFELIVWGANNKGQLGNSSTNNVSSPIQIGGGAFWQEVSSASEHMVAVRSDGTLWTWGESSNGRLGDHSTADRSSPVQIGGDSDWQKVAAGSRGQGFAIKTDGTLWSWGRNYGGCLGDGTTNNRSSPVQIGSDTDWKHLGGSSYDHTAAIKTDGTLWTWGLGWVGALGNGGASDRSSPIQVGALTTWDTVGCGRNFCAALKTDGTIWAWGRNNYGQLAQITHTSARYSPVQVGTDTDWQILSVSGWNCTAIKSDGTIWSWGSNWSGELGTGNNNNQSSPVQVGALTDWVNAIASDGTVLAMRSNGTLWGWGGNGNGQLAQTHTSDRNSPVQISTYETGDKLSNFTHGGTFLLKKKGS